jgi:hypothetical protein
MEHLLGAHYGISDHPVVAADYNSVGPLADYFVQTSVVPQQVITSKAVAYSGRSQIKNQASILWYYVIMVCSQSHRSADGSLLKALHTQDVEELLEAGISVYTTLNSRQ